MRGRAGPQRSIACQWKSYANGRIESLTAGLDDNGRKALEIIAGAPLDQRLALAEQLAASMKPDAGMGTKGGKTTGESGGLLPAELASMSDYHSWIANLGTDPEGRAMLADRKKMAAIREEARRKFN